MRLSAMPSVVIEYVTECHDLSCSITSTNNIIINSLKCYISNYLGCMKICKGITWLRRRKRTHLTMNSVSHNKQWNLGTVQVQLEPPLIPPIKINNNDKWDKDIVKMKLYSDPTSEKLDLYEFKVAFFDNCEPEIFFVHSVLQHNYRGVKNDEGWRKDSIPLYAGTCRSVTSV